MQSTEFTVLVLGASGATGKHVVAQLLDRGCRVKAVLREGSALPEATSEHAALTIVRATLLDLSDAELTSLVEGCQAVVSCLGHNLSFKGLFGPPYRLVTDAARRICELQTASDRAPLKYVLMNTAGNRNLDLDESVSFAETIVLGLLRVLLPPHTDNEQAANYLRTTYRSDDEKISWVIVRPDDLTNAEKVTPYTLHPSPLRSAIFDAGKTSRINVAHLMASLIVDEGLWQQWKGQMPLIYNAD